MNKILDRLSLKESIELNMETSQLKKKINSKLDKPFRVVWLSEHEFKFISDPPFWSLIIDKGPTEGIKGFAKIIDENNGRTKIILQTKVSAEKYFLIIAFLIVLFNSIRSKEEDSFWVFIIMLIPILWLWFVFRYQVKKLFKKFKEYLSTK